MATWLGTAYRYLSIDSTNDLTAATLNVGDATLTYPVAADLVSSPAPDVAARLGDTQPPPPVGMARYWWRVIVGVGTSLPMVVGVNTLYGQLTDLPEVEPHEWRFRIT